MKAVMLRAAAALAVAVTLGLLAAGTASAEDLSIERLTVGQSGTATVHLTLEDVPAPGLGAWTVRVFYDPEVIAITSCTAPPAGICNPPAGAGVIHTAGATSSGLIGDTTLATINISCLDIATTALTIVVVTLADATVGTPQPIPPTIDHGAVTCLTQASPPGLLGDVDCDGVVTAIDAQLILQYAAQLILSMSCQQNADVNGDGLINPIDAQLILQFVAGLIPSL